MLKVAVILTVLYAVSGDPTLKSPISGNFGVVGGETAAIKDFPWQVSVQYLYNHICGGFLISNNWVITAASCVNSRDIDYLTVVAGTNKWYIKGQEIEVFKRVIHPNYKEADLNSNIALLELMSHVSVDFVRAATLSTEEDISADANLTVVGWGVVLDREYASRELHQVNITTISQTACTNAYSSAKITDTVFCAGQSEQGGINLCQGDAGGSALINGKVVGVVSGGFGCEKPGLPSVFIKVSSFRAWIREVTGI